MSQFLFPMLKTSEILSCLEELGLEVSKVELTEPHRHKDKIKSLFTFFVRIWNLIWSGSECECVW